MAERVRATGGCDGKDMLEWKGQAERGMVADVAMAAAVEAEVKGGGGMRDTLASFLVVFYKRSVVF